MASAILFSSLLILSVSVDFTHACFASGVCGGGCAPPPPPTCGGGCGGGYACGQYGCYRARARAASSLTLSVDKHAKKPTTPDEKFMSCCIDRNLPDSCLNKCSFRTYTKAALQAMYFKQDSCPMQAAADIQYCAAQGKDHRECCARNGVATTLAGYKCMTFCDQRPGNITQLDFTYLACYDRFENMKSCFWHDLSQEISPEISFAEDVPPQTSFFETNPLLNSFNEDANSQTNFRVPGGARTFRAKSFSEQ
ncbi:DB module [Dictyocaulus viviparus]|uniref:DB module n=1 Tax=Dictyocaulus viviparus TaxID=29172 RepID=A0A0D8XHH0_DICVI|nr:DB module [Dictyocaulus viviparus]